MNNRPYKAVMQDGKPVILNGEALAHYQVQPDFDTIYQATHVAIMLNNAREIGYNSAKDELKRWLGK